MNNVLRVALVAALAISLQSCAEAPPRPRTPDSGRAISASPIARSTVLITHPGDDTELLGRVLPSGPDPGHSLEQTLRPNPCASVLGVRKVTRISDNFNDTTELSPTGPSGAMLRPFGLLVDTQQASHFYYKLVASRRVERSSSTDYAACCQQNDCGYGYVSALVYGDGEYATGLKVADSTQAHVVIASEDGTVALRFLHRRMVHGWLAAEITITDPSAGAEALGPMGLLLPPEMVDARMPTAARDLFEQERITLTPSDEPTTWLMQDGRGNTITENEFVRRYKRVTGSQELDDYQRTRDRGPLVGLVVSSAAALGGLVLFTTGGIGKDCNGSSCGITPKGYAAVGLLSLGITTAPLFLLFYHPDGHLENDHFLTSSEAKLYLNRYHQVLRRKAMKDTLSPSNQVSEPKSSAVRLSPSVSPEMVGISGTF